DGAAAGTEAAIWGTLGFLMYRGIRWAMIIGMLLWTYEKGALLVQQVSRGNGGAPIVQIIWWGIYLSAFYLAYRVENTRPKDSAPAPASKPSAPLPRKPRPPIPISKVSMPSVAMPRQAPPPATG